MTHNNQRSYCAAEIDILLGEISNEENFPNARADDLTVHASKLFLCKLIPLNHTCVTLFEFKRTKNVLEYI